MSAQETIQKAIRARRQFTAEEDQAIREYYRQGKLSVTIAERLGRTVTSIQSRTKFLGLD